MPKITRNKTASAATKMATEISLLSIGGGDVAGLTTKTNSSHEFPFLSPLHRHLKILFSMQQAPRINDYLGQKLVK